jgi:hypothetical protein
VLVFRDVDFFDDAGDVGRDADLVELDIGVVRGHHLAARDVPIVPAISASGRTPNGAGRSQRRGAGFAWSGVSGPVTGSSRSSCRALVLVVGAKAVSELKTLSMPDTQARLAPNAAEGY